MFLGRVSTPRPSLWKSVLRLLDPRVSSATACRELMQSLPLRKWKGEALVRMPEKCPHLLIIAPSRTGKGASLIVPLLRMSNDSMIVHDTKAELYKLTADWRRQMGQRVVCLAPWEKDSDHLNPLEFIDPDSNDALDDCRDIARSIVVRGQEKDSHWNDKAEVFIGAMTVATVCFLEPASRNLHSVRELLVDEVKRQRAIDMLCESDKWNGLLSCLGNELKSCKGEELSGVISTASRHLSFLGTPAVRACTSDSTLHLDDIKRRPMSVYICIPPEHIRAQMGLARLFLAACMRAVVKQGLGGNTVRVVLDEAAALGRLEQLDDLVDKYAGYNLKSLFVYQSMGQLGRCWEDGGQTLLSNTAQVFFAVNDVPTAEYVSKRLGAETVAVVSGGWNRGGSHSYPDGGPSATNQGNVGKSWGESGGWNQVKVPLLLPEQILTLPERLALVFVPSTPPAAVALARYYEDELFQKPPVLRQTFAAIRTLAASLSVLCLSILLVVAAVSMEPRTAPVRQGPQPKASPYKTGIFNPD